MFWKMTVPISINSFDTNTNTHLHIFRVRFFLFDYFLMETWLSRQLTSSSIFPLHSSRIVVIETSILITDLLRRSCNLLPSSIVILCSYESARLAEELVRLWTLPNDTGGGGYLYIACCFFKRNKERGGIDTVAVVYKVAAQFWLAMLLRSNPRSDLQPSSIKWQIIVDYDPIWIGQRIGRRKLCSFIGLSFLTVSYLVIFAFSTILRVRLQLLYRLLLLYTTVPFQFSYHLQKSVLTSWKSTSNVTQYNEWLQKLANCANQIQDFRFDSNVASCNLSSTFKL